ncbi:MAG TPA: glycoside hydrolase family 3 C-terminal domain-containing protein [Lachnospiraceae bacterium]
MKRELKERVFSGTNSKEVSKRELEHRKLAKKAGLEGIVLLKNEENILPLDKNCKIALYGKGADHTVKGGTGSGDVNERESISIYQGVLNAGFTVTTKEWIEEYDRIYMKSRYEWRDRILKKAENTGDESSEFFAIYSSDPFFMPEENPVTKTDADVAIYVISRFSGEGMDRREQGGDYYLDDNEKKTLGDICRLYDRVIVVVNTGGQMDLSFLDDHDNIKGLFYIGYSGMEGGNAFADLLLGKENPSGKLTASWTYRYEDYPNAKNFSYMTGDKVEKYEEDIYVGYRYFESFKIPVRYGFGYGLSYTDFSVQTLSLDKEIKEEGSQIRVEVAVKNIKDSFSGKEIVQLYLALPDGKLKKEDKRLLAFQKTKRLSCGEEEKLTLSFAPYDMASFDEQTMSWILEEGEYGLLVGNSLQSAVCCGKIKVEENLVFAKVKEVFPLDRELQRFEAGEKKFFEIAKGVKEISLGLADVKTEAITYRQSKEYTEKEAREFVDSLTLDQCIALATGDPHKGQGSNLGAAGISVPGSAGETSEIARQNGLASMVLADGPAGLRLMKYYDVQDGKIVSKPFMFSLENGLFCPEYKEQVGERYYQYCTAIPVGVNLAQTWNLPLVEELGVMIAKEMEEFRVSLWLAPGMNINRNPLCGRNFEYYSEDPLLSGKIASAMTKGVQSLPGHGTTIKHFACNNVEDDRMQSNSVVSERALREIYLKGFEIAVKESQPMSIMTSYNLINGIHSANHKGLCTDIARSEWGYRGMIMTDWTTTEQGEDCTASGCMRAGNDVVMPGTLADRENIKKELEDGSLDIEDLKACIARLVDTIWKSREYK